MLSAEWFHGVSKMSQSASYTKESAELLGDRGLSALAQVPAENGAVAGAFQAGIEALRDAIAGGDRRPGILSAFVDALQRLSFLPPHWKVEESLAIALDSPAVLPFAAVVPTLLILKSQPAFGEAFALAARGDGMGLARLLDAGALQAEMARPLMLALLKRTIVSGPEIEFILTQMRRYFLGKAFQGFAPSAAEQALSLALAHQCFLNEYVYFTAPDERALLERLTGVSDFAVAVMASYAPLSSYPLKEGLPDSLVEQQIAEPAAERALAGEIARIGAISDATSQRVRSLYEETPYPRWGTPYIAPTRETKDIYRLKYPGADFTPLDRTEIPEILVAGCGTGFNLLMSVAGYRDYRLTAIDLSLNSLSHAARHVRDLGLPNIRLMQGDILELGALDRSFDIVESIGVLHHMADPMAGWRILADKLKPGGVMQIGLYSTLARTAIHRLRDYARARGFPPTREGMIAFRREVFAILRRPSHPDHALVAETRLAALHDFYSLSGCRDLLFHTQEASYTIPELAGMIGELGLRFLGFSFPSPAFLNAYRARFPGDSAAADLGNWHVFERENPSLFVRMYNFSLQKPF